MIYDITPVNNHKGNNNSTKFDFDFYIDNEKQIVVYLYDKNNVKHELILGKDYTINEVKNENGSYITFPIENSSYDILSDEEKLSIELTLPISQETQYNNSSLLNLKALEYSLDYLTRLIQIIARRIARCVKVEEMSELTPDEMVEKIYQAKDDTEKNAKNVQENTKNVYEVLEHINKTSEEIDKLKENFKPSTNNSLGIVKPDNKTTFVDEKGTLSAPKYNLFDLIQKDHILTFEESFGLAQLGTYVYKEGADGRYGYPDFYQKCLEEYKEGKDSVFSISFVQPVLTENGTLGGDSFAVSASSENSDSRQAYKSFDGNKDTKWGVKNISTKEGDLTFYNPKALKIKSITYVSSSDYPTEDGGDIEILGSNDNSSWDSLYQGDYLGASGATKVFEINSEKYYSYHKISITNGKSAYLGLGNLTIDALEKVADIKENANQHKFYDIKDKDKIDEIYNNIGAAWLYGIDEEEERIFLPRNNYFFQNNEEIGKYIEAGLPNITGTTKGAEHCESQTVTGCFYNEKGLGASPAAGEGGNYGHGFDASLSNPIYGKSETVQPPAVGVAIYIVVGNTSISQAKTNIVELTTSTNDTIPLFMGQYFDFNPNHISWIKAGTEASGKIYESAYNELVKISKGQETKYGEGFKVVKENEKLPDTDYSEYWIVDEDKETFTAPLKLSFLALSSDKAPVIGNGKSLTFSNGTDEYPIGIGNYNANAVIVPWHDTSLLGHNVGEEISGANSIASNNLAGLTTDPELSGLVADLSNLKSDKTQLYFKVANAVENIELLDAGEVLENLNNKISKTECRAYIVETYQNDLSGYRIWSDGFCEQWTSRSWGDTGSFTFLKPYKDTNWILVFNSLNSDTNSNLGVISKTNTGFEYNNALTTLSGDMYVIGYLKEGE